MQTQNEGSESVPVDAIVMRWDELLWELLQFTDAKTAFGPDVITETVLRLKYKRSEIRVESGPLFEGNYRPNVIITADLKDHAEAIAMSVLDGNESDSVQVDLEGFFSVTPNCEKGK